MGKINLKEKKSKSYNFNLWSSYLSSHQKRILSCIKDYMKSLIYNSMSNSFWLLMKESGKVKNFLLFTLYFFIFFSHSLYIACIAQMLVNFLISPALEVQVSLSGVKERRMTLDDLNDNGWLCTVLLWKGQDTEQCLQNPSLNQSQASEYTRYWVNSLVA